MNLNKVLTIVAGFSQDSAFNYACYIADNLSSLLPNFSMKKKTKKSSDWNDWLEKKCQKYGWSHTDSPLIWRQTGVCGGSSEYIGGILEFKMFINNYYGIDSVLSETEQVALDLDYSLAEEFALKNKFEDFVSNAFHITISGAGRSVCPDLVSQLATMKQIGQNGIVISLYDTPGHFFKIKDIVRDAVAIGGELCSVKILENLSDGLNLCNVLIILDHISRDDQENTNSWLLRNYEASREIAEQINIYAPSDIRVIFCSNGPTCFCANVIAKEATKLNKNNIVAVSAHYGLEMLYGFIKSVNVDAKGIGCPPVWGFLGISQYVDIHHTVQKAYVSNKKALSCPENSTLPLGVKCPEFRWLFYLTHDKKPHEIVANRKITCLYQVGRTEDFQKCKALCDLLKFWYQKDEAAIGDEIITLGISSDGTFNIPNGLFFSQPVYLKVLEDNSRIWVPCPEFPTPYEDTPIILKNCVEVAKSILENMGLLD